MDVDSSSSSTTTTAAAAAPAPAPETDKKKKAAQARKEEELKDLASTLPEADAFLSLLCIISLLDHKQYARGKQLATESIERFAQLNRRSLDQLMSKLYFYWVRLHETSGDDTAALRPCVPSHSPPRLLLHEYGLTPPPHARRTLLAAQRTAALRHDDDLQATLLPLLLRNYLEHGLYEQADRLVSKTQFPEQTAQNSQLARWYYYVGQSESSHLAAFFFFRPARCW